MTLIRDAPRSVVRVVYRAAGAGTRLARVHESGGLRLRHLRGARCEAVLVNVAGGIVAGDRLEMDVSLDPGAAATLTSAAAEKIYRSDGETAFVSTHFELAAASRLDWLPQETILFDGARLERRLTVEMAEDARLNAAEIVVFGRLARGERMTKGFYRDDWRVHRGGRLVFADATRLEGDIGAMLDRPAVGGGARAAALILSVGPQAAAELERVRRVMATCPDVEAAVSAREDLLVARFVGPAADRLRALAGAVLEAIRGAPMPRGWH